LTSTEEFEICCDWSRLYRFFVEAIYEVISLELDNVSHGVEARTASRWEFKYRAAVANKNWAKQALMAHMRLHLGCGTGSRAA
jgi:hypothetical protein